MYNIPSFNITYISIGTFSLLLFAREKSHIYRYPLERLKEVKEVKNPFLNSGLDPNFFQLKKAPF
jgi:hypothetical protein